MGDGAAVLLTDHSGAAAGRVAIAATLARQRDLRGRGRRAGGTPAARRLVLRASHPDGRRGAGRRRGRGRRRPARPPRRRLAHRGGAAVRGAARYLMLVATRTRAPLPALAATLFLVIGVFWYRRNEVGGVVGPDRAPELRARGLAGRRGAGRRAARPGGHGDGGTRRPAPSPAAGTAARGRRGGAPGAGVHRLPARPDRVRRRRVRSRRAIRRRRRRGARAPQLRRARRRDRGAVQPAPAARWASAIAAALAVLVGLAAIGGAAGPVAGGPGAHRRGARHGRRGHARRVRGLPRPRRGRAGRRDALGAQRTG